MSGLMRILIIGVRIMSDRIDAVILATREEYLEDLDRVWRESVCRDDSLVGDSLAEFRSAWWSYSGEET